MGKCSWHCTLTSVLWPLSLSTGSSRSKNSCFSSRAILQVKGKTRSYTICRDWLSEFVSTEALSATVARWAFTLWSERGKVLHRAFPPFFAWLHISAYGWAATWHFSFLPLSGFFTSITVSHLSLHISSSLFFFFWLFFWLREQDDNEGLDYLYPWQLVHLGLGFVFSLLFLRVLFISLLTNPIHSLFFLQSEQSTLVWYWWEHWTPTCSSSFVQIQTKSHSCKYLKAVRYQRITVILIISCATVVCIYHPSLEQNLNKGVFPHKRNRNNTFLSQNISHTHREREIEMKCLISGDVKLSVWDNPRAWCILTGIAKSNKQHNTSHDAVHIGLYRHTPQYWKGTGLVWYCPQWRMESDTIDELRRGLSARSFSDITHRHTHTHIQNERVR